MLKGLRFGKVVTTQVSPQLREEDVLLGGIMYSFKLIFAIVL